MYILLLSAAISAVSTKGTVRSLLLFPLSTVQSGLASGALVDPARLSADEFPDVTTV